MPVDLALVRDELSAPLVCDVLDAAGERPQVLGPDVVPLLPDSVLAGWAFGVRLERAAVRPEAPYDIDGRYEIAAHRVPAVLDGITVHPGDLVVGDSDGVVVVPRDRAAEVVTAALAKRRGELDFRAAVAGGSSPTEAYRRFGVL